MECNEFEKSIPDFLNHRMNFLEIKKFREHVEHCQECSEELEIQFLVTAGMKRLEEGDAFDLKNELEYRMEEARRKERYHYFFLKVGFWLEMLAVVVIAGCVVYLLL